MYLPVDVSFGCARCGMRQHWLAVTGRAATAYGGELWNRVESRIEMHLESTCDQCVNIRAAQLSIQFAAFETIHTDSRVHVCLIVKPASSNKAPSVFRVNLNDPRQWYAVTLAGLR